MLLKPAACLWVACSALLLGVAPLSPAEESLLKAISADSIKGHVSFLASDLLEGRDTPSRGLDIAADYVAAQFRRFGLEPAGDDGYFQNANFATVRQPMDTFEMTLTVVGKPLTVAKDRVGVQTPRGAEIENAQLFKVDIDALDSLTASQVEGKAVIWTIPSLFSLPDAERGNLMRKLTNGRQALARLKPAVVLTTGMGGGQMGGGRRLRDLSDQASASGISLSIRDADAGKVLADLPAGPVEGSFSAKIPAPEETPVKLKNVVGMLRGQDPELKDTWILVTAHYDHVGVRTSGEGDLINNGANDDASGTSSVLELASAFAKSPQRPKRSILFMTYFGEEKGLLGSRFYGRNPIVPLKQTVANLNLEHMGRTDDTEGSTVGKLTASGFDYTSMGELLGEAGKLTGIDAWHHAKNSDAFFGRSDNQSLADSGVPAITLAVSWIFPDYHRPGDHWDKLDYANMEKVNRTVAVTLWRLANDASAPKWIDSNPKTEKYVKAYKALHGLQ